jgi:hypothetical protein
LRDHAVLVRTGLRLSHDGRSGRGAIDVFGALDFNRWNFATSGHVVASGATDVGVPRLSVGVPVSVTPEKLLTASGFSIRYK